MTFSDLSTTTVVRFINWPTIVLLFGFFVLSAQLRLSGFFDKFALAISARLGNPARFLLVLMAVTAGLSAVLNHDIVCYVFAPVVASSLLRKQVNPVPFLIALAIASNIGAAATLVGNPQDMMIVQVARLRFGHYMVWCFTPVLSALGCATSLFGSCPVTTSRSPVRSRPVPNLPFIRTTDRTRSKD
jgi:Na+/H+ antiporter NhaD/arsenite permease-like protein